MRRVENEILSAGYREICLRASLNAVPFYERLGYIRGDEQKMTLGSVEARVVAMSKGPITYDRSRP